MFGLRSRWSGRLASRAWLRDAGIGKLETLALLALELAGSRALLSRCWAPSERFDSTRLDSLDSLDSDADSTQHLSVCHCIPVPSWGTHPSRLSWCHHYPLCDAIGDIGSLGIGHVMSDGDGDDE